MKFVDLTPTGNLRRQLDAAYERVMASGQYISGAEVEAFEREWADYIGTRYCVACGNGFDALQLVLRALLPSNIQHAVIVPAWTATPTWAAVEARGDKPCPDTDYWGRAAIQIIVHLYGIPCIRNQDYNHLGYIEDCAQAHGAAVNGKRCGSLGLAGCWSFYPTKNLGAYGDGGAITTDDEALAGELRLLRSYGKPGAINSRLDPLQAAFLRVKLRYLDGWNARRREIAAMYLSGLRDLPVILPSVPDNTEPVWHQFAIQTPRRDELKAHLAERGIPTMIHYPVPPHRALGYDYDLPEADRLAAEVLSLPIGPHLSDGDVAAVIAAIREWAGD